MNDKILLTSLYFGDYPINLNFLLLQGYLQGLILLVWGFVQLVGVDDQKDKQHQDLRHLYRYHHHSRQYNGDIIGEDIGAEGEMVGYGLYVWC